MRSPETITEIASADRRLRFVQLDYRFEVRMPGHAHEVACLNWCLRGQLEERWGGRTFAQHPGALSLLPAGLRHENRFPGGCSAFVVALEAQWTCRDDRLAALV